MVDDQRQGAAKCGHRIFLELSVESVIPGESCDSMAMMRGGG
jgi:hypothetical protein